MKNFTIVLGVLIVAGLVAGTAFGQAAPEKAIKSYVETLRKDIRTQKQSLVDQGMGLDAAQKSQFWTIYNNYQTELNVIGDQRVANMKKYAENFDKMTDATADQLAAKMLDIEGQRTTLKKKYYAAFKEKMGARVAARFLQVETMLNAFIDLQLGSELPILQ